MYRYVSGWIIKILFFEIIWFFPRIFKPSNHQQPNLIAVQFNKENSIKEITSLLVTDSDHTLEMSGAILYITVKWIFFQLGVSPEFEIALYTIIFLCEADQITHTRFANMKVAFHCYKIQRNYRTVLSTIYAAKN